MHVCFVTTSVCCKNFPLYVEFAGRPHLQGLALANFALSGFLVEKVNRIVPFLQTVFHFPCYIFQLIAPRYTLCPSARALCLSHPSCTCPTPRRPHHTPHFPSLSVRVQQRRMFSFSSWCRRVLLPSGLLGNSGLILTCPRWGSPRLRKKEDFKLFIR